MFIEVSGFYTAIEKEHLGMAMEVRPWGTFMEHDFDPVGTQPLFKKRAKHEALRLADYIRAHPNSPVNLLTYSGGALFAFEVGAAMPADTPVDRIIVVNPGIWTNYDVAPTLDHVTHGVVSYYSSQDTGVNFIAGIFGTADAHFSDVASELGFSYQDPRLIQVPWTPEMAKVFNNGGHLDGFLNTVWIRQYIVPWLITEK